MNKKVASIIASIAVSLSGFALVVSFAPHIADAGSAGSINICHATDSDNNPWNALQINVSALSTHLSHGDFTYQGPVQENGHPDEDGDEWCAENEPTSEEINNTCSLPDSLGDTSHQSFGESYGSEPTVQEILNTSGYSSVDAVNDQVEYQNWNVTSGQEVIVSPKFLNKFAASNIVFGYYKNSDVNTFAPIFKKGSVTGFESTPEANIGDSYTVSAGTANTIGFAIKASYESDMRTLATQSSLNVGGYDQAVVYNPASNEYILAFEDIVNGGDNDYNDMVVSVKLSCETSNPENPQLCTIYSNTDTKVEEVRIDFGTPTVVNYPSVLVTPTSITDTHWTADVDGASTNAKWIWSEDPVQDWTVDKLVNFTRTFTVTDAGTSATLQLAVDNAYSVYLDNVLIGFNNATIFNTAFGDTIVIPNISVGEHTLKFVVQNLAQAGEAINNPGGLLFNLTLNNQSCTNGGGGGDENHAPTLDIIGGTVHLTVGQTYVEPGVVAYDHEDFPGSSRTYPADTNGFNVVGLPPVGTTTVSGLYTVLYTFTDSDGAQSNTITRLVNVSAGTTQCSDGTDNDGDEMTDANDSGCHTDGNVSNINSYDPNDNNEDTSLIVDVCLNIDGNQTSAPEGMQSSGGLCAPIDLCPNIPGDQAAVPEGTHLDDGMCVEDGGNGGGGDGDVCPETDGIQTSLEECGQGGGEGELPEDTGGRSGGRSSSRGGGFVAPQGLVLGASTSCGIYLNDYLQFGAQNDKEEVLKLQSFLNENLGVSLKLNGIFDAQTLAAVNAFQLKYKEEILAPWVAIGLLDSVNKPTGFVYRTTQRKINDLYCEELNLPIPDLSDELSKRSL